MLRQPGLDVRGGRIGVRFAGVGEQPSRRPNDVRFDNFGGGNVAVSAGGYNPNLYEVGPGKPVRARSRPRSTPRTRSAGNDLVVVYPGQPTSQPRNNPRGAYYENLIIASPVKLQGVGPGGFQGNDVSCPARSSTAAPSAATRRWPTDWYTKVGALTWDGNQDVNDGEAIYVLASRDQTTAASAARQFTSYFKASDRRLRHPRRRPAGLPGQHQRPHRRADRAAAQRRHPGRRDLRQRLRPLPADHEQRRRRTTAAPTARSASARPTCRRPTPNQHNENVRIANNRIIANAGTNLAGGIGLFAGVGQLRGRQQRHLRQLLARVRRRHQRLRLEPERQDPPQPHLLQPLLRRGRRHHDRRRSCRPTPTTLSPGSGPVDIYNNLIQANLANDDGGGLRFLMAGNFPMNVYNNMIVNNVSTHEGGGVGLNDAPNVRVFNNTVMKNLTTATAVTSNGQPAPAGLSTSANSDQLQATLPGGSPIFSNPLLFNNIFWDNRAGTRAGTTVTGLGVAGDATPINHWDLGVADGTGPAARADELGRPADAGAHPYTTSPTNSVGGPERRLDRTTSSCRFATWRQNPAFVDATLVTVELPPNLLG